MRAARERALVVLLAATGCDEAALASEGGAFTLVFAGLRTEQLVPWEAPHRVVEGTLLCPQARCEACEAAGTCEAVEVTAEGLADAGDGCFVATPGAVSWRVGAPCDADDRATLTVVDAEAVGAELVLWPDRWAATQGALHGAELTPPGAPLRVVAQSQVRLPVRLFTRADGRTVGWDAGEVRLAATRGRAPVAYPGESLAAVMFADAAATASFSAAEHTWPLGQVEGVRADAAVSLTIAAAHDADGAPRFARAVARDADGAVLVGLPVTWSVEEGALALAAGGDLPGQDYVGLGDECVAPERRGGARSAVIAARHGGLSASLELRWQGQAGAEDPRWQPDDACPEGGCGCRSETAGWPGLLLLLGAYRRRGGRR